LTYRLAGGIEAGDRMGLKDRLLQAKCKVGVHSGEWQQLAAGSCDEQRTCAHCGEVSNRTSHHLSDWAYSDDPAAPACTRERQCQRCPHVEQEVKHTMEFRYDYPGRHEVCRQRLDCTRCGFTEGTTHLNHHWDKGVVSSDDGGYRLRKIYTCLNCKARIPRATDGIPPYAHSHDYL
jgi:hypothetical protein